MHVNLFKKLFGGSKSGGAANQAQVIRVDTDYVTDRYKNFVSPELKKHLLPGDDPLGRYPSLDLGVPTLAPGRELLFGHQDKIKKIANGIGLPPDKFKRLILPVIENYADFVHFLPASNGYHHSGFSGLISHSLEVATLAVNTAQSTSFDHGGNPSKRTMRRERWYAASVIAALMHDAGKPLTDMLVHDVNHTKFWPGTNSIPEWGAETGVDRYILSWVKGRGEKHKNLSTTLVERIVPLETRNWLIEGGADLYHAMVEAISGIDTKSVLTGIIIKADSTSVEMDLQNYGGDASGVAGTGALSSNISGKFCQAARYLVDQGTWTANAHGSRIWVTPQGIFLAWKSAISEVIDYFDSNKIKGTPRGPESLGGALIDSGIFEPNAEGELYWEVAPDALANPEAGKLIRLKCVKVANYQTLYPFEVPPKPVAVLIGPEGNCTRYDPADGGVGISLAPAQGDAQNSAPVGAMFSLDTPAPIFPAQAQAPVSMAQPDALSKPGATPQPATISGPSLAESKPAAPKPASPAKPGAKKGPVQKTAADLGITLKVGGAAPATPAIVIGGGSQPAGGAEAGSALAAMAERVGKGGGKPAAATPAVPQDKQQAKSGQKKSEKPQAQAAESSPTATPAPAQQEPAIHQAPVIQDEFSGLLAVSLDALSDAEPAPSPVQGEWEDPFAGAVDSGASVAAAEPQLAEISPHAVSEEEEEGYVPDLPVRPVISTPAPVTPETSFAIEPVADEPVAFKVDTGEDADWLKDFDPELLAQAGLPKPAFVEKSERREAAKKAVDNGAPPAQEKIHIPSEFIFDDEPDIDFKAFADVPSSSPTGFSPPPASIEIQVREESIEPDGAGLTEIDLSQFDLPVFADGVVSGEVASLPEVKTQQPARERAPSNDAAPAHALGASPVSEPAAPVENKLPTEVIDGRARRRAMHRDALEGIGIRVGQPGPAEESVKPAITFVTPEPKGNEGAIHIGIPPRRGRAKQLATKEEVMAIIKKGPGRLRSRLTPEEAAEVEAFLALTPELTNKLWFYVANSSSIGVQNWRPVLHLDAEGFTAEDVPVLEQKMWLWNDFLSESGSIVWNNNTGGVVVSPYIAEIICHLSDGEFDISTFYPQSTLDIVALEEVARIAIQDCPVVQQVGDYKLYSMRRGYLAETAVRLEISEQDLRRALIATQDVAKQRNNLVIKVFSKGNDSE